MIPGPLLFARYAIMPNRLGYCGGEDDQALLEYGTSGNVDAGLIELEQQFEGAYSYLQLIARANGIDDPLDSRVVEAYWIGNSLLDHVDMGALYASVEGRFKPRTKEADWRWLASKPPAGARPHHSFHVFETYPRIGLLRSGAVEDVVATMENCRIRWGEVKAVLGAQLLVEVQPLVLDDGRLRLGDARLEQVRASIDGSSFVSQAKEGDWVSIHWGWACDTLTTRQRLNVERYTGRQLALCNQTL